jgi:hypothetical protein
MARVPLAATKVLAAKTRTPVELAEMPGFMVGV